LEGQRHRLLHALERLCARRCTLLRSLATRRSRPWSLVDPSIYVLEAAKSATGHNIQRKLGTEKNPIFCSNATADVVQTRDATVVQLKNRFRRLVREGTIDPRGDFARTESVSGALLGKTGTLLPSFSTGRRNQEFRAIERIVRNSRSGGREHLGGKERIFAARFRIAGPVINGSVSATIFLIGRYRVPHPKS